MDTFDEFNQTTQITENVDEQDLKNQQEDLFGSEFTTNTEVASASTNPFNNVQQQPQQQYSDSWVIDDVKQKEIFFPSYL